MSVLSHTIIIPLPSCSPPQLKILYETLFTVPSSLFVPLHSPPSSLPPSFPPPSLPSSLLPHPSLTLPLPSPHHTGSLVVMAVAFPTTSQRRVCVRTVTLCVNSVWDPGLVTAPPVETQGNTFCIQCLFELTFSFHSPPWLLLPHTCV